MKNLLRTAVSFLLSLLLCVSALAEPITETVTVNGVECTPRQNLFTCLFLGLSGSDPVSERPATCGTAFILVTDKAQDTYAVIVIDGSTVVDQAGTPLSEAFAEGGSASAAQAVSDLLFGITINCTTTVETGAVGILNSSVGGVTVTINSDLTKIDPAMTAGTTLCLTDEQALSFVSRIAADPSERISRQEQYLSAVCPLLIAACEADPSFISSLTESSDAFIDTNMTDKDFSYLAKAISQNTSLGFFSPEGSSTEDNVFIPDEAALTELVTGLFYLPAGQ